MIEYFDEHKFDYIPSCTNFVTLKFVDEDKSNNFANNLLIDGVIVRNLKGFGLENCVRVSVGTPEENECFCNVLTNLKQE